jgi:hypothetical protein
MIIEDTPLEFRRIRDLPEVQRNKILKVDTADKAGLLVALCSVTEPTFVMERLGKLSDEDFWNFFYKLIELNEIDV